MPLVVVLDSDGVEHTAEVESGTDLIDACEQAGVSVLRSCGRGGQCGTCVVTLLAGRCGDMMELSPPMGDEELATMEDYSLDPAHQVLSCSCSVFGPVKVQVPA